MTISPNELMEELKGLRKGRGLHAPGLDRLIGPALRELCDIAEGDGAEDARRRIQAWVTQATTGFPEDLRIATLTSLGLNPDAQQAFLAERVDWLAKRESRDARTIRRRVDVGLERLAEVAMQAHAAAGKSDDESEKWYVRRFKALLRLDGPTPACTETRTIVATGEPIDHIPWSISLPRTGDDRPGDLDVQVLEGAVFGGMERPSASRFLMNLQLPGKLQPGQEHTFGLEVRVPQGQPMRPTYVFWPERRCERFDLTVRFDPAHLPRQVWRVNAVFHRDADEIEPGPDQLIVNGIGEVSASFLNPRPDRGYGIQWRL
ncbi:MAG TPA: hypothetical protein VHW44_05095 [Pseudonocardiaceae bacterium]|jgi:hypothetical protein|nr:hypothetical protein [Pseudonocardiaceae bacterium]